MASKGGYTSHLITQCCSSWITIISFVQIFFRATSRKIFANDLLAIVVLSWQQCIFNSFHLESEQFRESVICSLLNLDMKSKTASQLDRFKNFFFALFFIILFSLSLTTVIHYLPLGVSKISQNDPIVSFSNLKHLLKVVILKNSPTGEPRNPKCTHYDCFNIYRCGQRDHKIQVYVYPLKNYVDENGDHITTQISIEYYKILKTIVNSKYYSPNPEEACILVPSIDTLNQNRLRLNEVSQALSSLPYWRNGENHLIWNFISGSPPDYSTIVELNVGKALIAGAGFSSWTYRPGFDISLPLYSPYSSSLPKLNDSHERKWFVINTQVNLHSDYERELETLPDLIKLKLCQDDDPTYRCYQGKTYKYPHVLQEATFCTIIRGARLGQQTLLESLAAGCIPVIAADLIVMPFQDVIDWKRAAIIIPENDITGVIERLASVSDIKKKELQQQGNWLYHKYFESVEKITLTTLDLINQRVYPQNAQYYEDWNIPPYLLGSKNPLKLQLTAPRTPGFTAVVLTYDRVESLFLLIQQLTRVPSLSKILVIWNNQNKDPPSTSVWPKLTVPMELIRTKENKLSNRFYPYDQIETEAVLSIDDDIVMLTPDELEFGFEVWREFPDRIVGFPSRTHVWDNNTNQWKYESEWTNRISMVLTGAAFHHKYWNYMYTTAMPGDIKQWVDSRMNCEDIAMNFLVANITRKAPIKVTPRKKFKCPECTNTEMLSADLTHMVERSRCINRFAAIYGTMPLINVEFRADPVLYKDNFPEKLKRYNDIGSL